MNGAPIPSRNLMVSIPRHTTTMLIAQNRKKQIQPLPGKLAAPGHKILSIEKIACPPIQA